jgi:hypothetical protein
LGGSLLVNAHDGGIDHLNLDVMACDDCVQQLVPDACFPPSVEGL